MKEHLVLILIFLLVVPLWTISWIWDDLLLQEQEAIQCQYERALLDKEVSPSVVIDYSQADLSSPDYQKYIALTALCFSFFIFGGYFFLEYMQTMGETARKVSFVNQVSHELKTPLTNLQLYIQLLKKSCNDDDDAMEKLHVLEQESLRLSRLVTNVLSYANGSRMEPNITEQNLDEIIIQVTEGFKPSFEQKNMSMQLECEAGVCSFDKGIVEQILINLIGNVEKYGGEDAVMKIKAWREDNIHIRVEDNGPGIPDLLKDAVMKPFVRGSSATNEGVSGIGIGLPLSVNLAKAHGGELKLVEVSEGACFEVVL